MDQQELGRKTIRTVVRHLMPLLLLAFWIGLYPGLTEDHLQYTVETIAAFIGR